MDKYEERALKLENSQKSRCSKYPPVDDYEVKMERDITKEIEQNRRRSKTYKALIDA